jgi:hypothetical protein
VAKELFATAKAAGKRRGKAIKIVTCLISGKRSEAERLDRAPPSEGKGHAFESCRVRHLIIKHWDYPS